MYYYTIYTMKNKLVSEFDRLYEPDKKCSIIKTL